MNGASEHYKNVKNHVKHRLFCTDTAKKGTDYIKDTAENKPPETAAVQLIKPRNCTQEH